VKNTSEKKIVKPDSSEDDLKPLHVRSVVNSLGTGTINPFIGPYAVKELGASSSDMGWFQSLSNLSNSVMQVFWGKLSDRLGRRIPFIVVGGLVIAALWVPMVFVTSASQLIFLIAIQALLGSMATPAWTALIGDLVPSFKLGRASAAINLWASVGGLFATLISGMVMVSVGGAMREQLSIPVAAATVCGVTSSLVILYVKEKRENRNLTAKKRFASDMLDVVTRAEKSPDFMRFSLTSAVFTFFMAISWPLFSITLVKVLNASMLEIALLSVVQGMLTIVFQSWAGRLADTIGRKPLLVLDRFILVTVPLVYAFSPSAYVLIAVGAFWGISTALDQASMTSYLLEVAPEGYRGSFTAFYNLLMGIVSFFGSLLGGYLSDYTISLFGLVFGLQMVYIISAVGRGIGATTYMTLRETLKQEKTP